MKLQNASPHNVESPRISPLSDTLLAPRRSQTKGSCSRSELDAPVQPWGCKRAPLPINSNQFCVMREAEGLKIDQKINFSPIGITESPSSLVLGHAFLHNLSTTCGHKHLDAPPDAEVGRGTQAMNVFHHHPADGLLDASGTCPAYTGRAQTVIGLFGVGWGPGSLSSESWTRQGS